MEEPASDDPAAAAGAREESTAGVAAAFKEGKGEVRFPASLAFGRASGLGNLTTKGEAAVDEFFPGKATAAATFTWKAGCTFFPPKVGIMARMI